VDLSRVYFIFADERMVSPDDPESNYGMVHCELLSRISIPPLHINRIRGEMNPDAAAHQYEGELEKILSLFDDRCDLILLGVGEDGHTASLFPGTRVLHEHQHIVQAVFVPHLDSWRVTLTLPVINRSRAVLFLVAGEHKAAIVGKIFASMQSRENMPATLVRPDSGMVTWMLDAKAASRIPPERLSLCFHGKGASTEDEIRIEKN
jgi:6-phosphogluconolactonase